MSEKYADALLLKDNVIGKYEDQSFSPHQQMGYLFSFLSCED